MDRLDEFEAQVTGRLSAMEGLDAWFLPWMAIALNDPEGYVKWVTSNALKGLDIRPGLHPDDKAQAHLHLEQHVKQMRANMTVIMERAAHRKAMQDDQT